MSIQLIFPLQLCIETDRNSKLTIILTIKLYQMQWETGICRNVEMKKTKIFGSIPTTINSLYDLSDCRKLNEITFMWFGIVPKMHSNMISSTDSKLKKIEKKWY